MLLKLIRIGRVNFIQRSLVSETCVAVFDVATKAKLVDFTIRQVYRMTFNVLRIKAVEKVADGDVALSNFRSQIVSDMEKLQKGINALRMKELLASVDEQQIGLISVQCGNYTDALNHFQKAHDLAIQAFNVVPTIENKILATRIQIISLFHIFYYFYHGPNGEKCDMVCLKRQCEYAFQRLYQQTEVQTTLLHEIGDVNMFRLLSSALNNSTTMRLNILHQLASINNIFLNKFNAKFPILLQQANKIVDISSKNYSLSGLETFRGIVLSDSKLLAFDCFRMCALSNSEKINWKDFDFGVYVHVHTNVITHQDRILSMSFGVDSKYQDTVICYDKHSLKQLGHFQVKFTSKDARSFAVHNNIFYVTDGNTIQTYSLLTMQRIESTIPLISSNHDYVVTSELSTKVSIDSNLGSPHIHTYKNTRLCIHDNYFYVSRTTDGLTYSSVVIDVYDMDRNVFVKSLIPNHTAECLTSTTSLATTDDVCSFVTSMIVNDEHIYTGYSDGTIVVYDLNTALQTTRFDAHSKNIIGVVVNESSLYTYTVDEVCMWDMVTMQRKYMRNNYNGKIKEIVVHDSQLFVNTREGDVVMSFL